MWPYRLNGLTDFRLRSVVRRLFVLISLKNNICDLLTLYLNSCLISSIDSEMLLWYVNGNELFNDRRIDYTEDIISAARYQSWYWITKHFFSHKSLSIMSIHTWQHGKIYLARIVYQAQVDFTHNVQIAMSLKYQPYKEHNGVLRFIRHSSLRLSKQLVRMYNTR